MSRTLNADSQDLQPLKAGPFIIGSVDDVNGLGACDVLEFTATRAELLELATYWATTYPDNWYFVFAYEQMGSTERRLCAYAERRVSRIVDLLGDDAVKAVQEASKEFANRVGSRNWEEFCQYLGPDHPYVTASGS